MTVTQVETPPPGIEPESARAGFLERFSGVIAPIITVLLAFLVSGIVVLLTTKDLGDTLETYRAIYRGSGLSWFFELGSNEVGLPFSDAKVWFPWNVDDISSLAAANLQQTLILWTALVLTGLAVAFAFRCGLFNIGGQGQYLAGSTAAILVATELPDIVDLPRALLIVVTVLGGMLAGAMVAGIAGFLKGTVGAHEVITTIMLNWIVIWVASYLFGIGGPFQTGESDALPSSADVAEDAKLPIFWGDPLLQGLHIGLFVALISLVVYSFTLNRTTLGYEVRAVGFNPEAARYGGISVARNYFLAMAIAGTFAGLAGALDTLGWQFRLDVTQIQGATLGFTGIAVALLGRNTAVGVGLAALLFAGLETGTASRNLDPEIFPPDLASSLAIIIQGLVVLFVGAQFVIVLLLRRARLRKVSTVEA
jgi:general nucleoside transport system permease protein